MKTIIIFYDQNSNYSKEKAFGGLSAVERTLNWAKELDLEVFTVNEKTVTDLVSKMSEIAQKEKADTVIYSYNDCPFLDVNLTKEILSTHKEFKSEYTFADGYSYGFSPEVIDAGTLGILAQLSKTTQTAQGTKSVNRTSIFDLIKTDINSFDIESVIAPNDWRLFRFNFSCGCKDWFMQCQGLWNAAEKSGGFDGKTPEDLCNIAAKTLECLKTVPGFYNIQISDFVAADYIYSPYVKEYSKLNKVSPVGLTSKGIAYKDFESLVDNIANYSQQAVVSLSAWGEAFENTQCLKMIEKVLSHEGLSVFIETDGLLVTDEVCQKLKSIVDSAAERTNGWAKIMVAVTLDATTAEMYKLVSGKTDSAATSDFNTALSAVSKLNDVIPGCVYPQFTRMNENEAELENFYRYWNEKTNPSGGNLIIQKYDSFAGTLPQRKVADLSPVDRNICWHLRRDMTILSNGNVPVCRDYIFDGIAGNVFKQSLEEVWKKSDKKISEHIENNFIDKCRDCDEFYTFNF